MLGGSIQNLKNAAQKNVGFMVNALTWTFSDTNEQKTGPIK